MNPIRGMLLLLFSPRRFVALAAEDAIKYEMNRAPEVRDPTTGRYPADRCASIETSIRGQVATIRYGILSSIGITTGTIVAGALAGLMLRAACQPVKWVVYALQAAGAAVILGATLAEVGRDIETWDRTTIPERVNSYTFRALYVLGTFLFVLSVAWDAD